MQISVIIPTHNRCDALDLTLEHLARQEFDGGWEAIVVDNNSTDDTIEVASRWRTRFPVELSLIPEKTPGPAAARNAGAKMARGEYLIFIDNDILTPSDYISRHFIRLQENPGCWIVGQFPNLPEQEATIFGRYRKRLEPPVGPHSELIEFDLITGQGTSLPKSDFDRLGGFDEGFFVASGEDRELALRAIASGIRILLDPSLIAFHNDWAGTSIRDYCRRQHLYTQTEPFFAAMYGEANPRAEMALRNSPIDLRGDSLALTGSKIGKSIVGSAAGQLFAIRLCEFVERLLPDTKLLDALYRTTIAGAIFRGYQEGIRKLDQKGRPAEHPKAEIAGK